MKKLVILTVGLFALLSTATAQILKTQADRIVLERLETEKQAYTFFDRDTIHRGFEVLTTKGEVLELAYPSYIYYIHYDNSNAGLYMIVNANDGNLLEVRTSYATQESKKKPAESDTLQGTQWKLIGIGSLEKTALQELEPKDCNFCYTLQFNSSTFGGIIDGTITANSIFGDYSVDYTTYALHFANVVETNTISTEVGRLYYQLLAQVQSYTITNTSPRTLQLQYNDGKNYLQYTEIKK
ncbi:MAG: META domain-containing protein [Bacteroidales bacterium]|jgi:hypothetical protein|nr:META domain-containing protein [Bacteroidales bacterium]